VHLEEQIERGLEHVFGGGARFRVRERVTRGIELREEAARDGHVQSPEVGGERLGDVTGRRERSRARRQWRSSPRGIRRVGMHRFVWMNRDLCTINWRFIRMNRQWRQIRDWVLGVNHRLLGRDPREVSSVGARQRSHDVAVGRGLSWTKLG
jgi:hypothetical protein